MAQKRELILNKKMLLHSLDSYPAVRREKGRGRARSDASSLRVSSRDNNQNERVAREG